MRKVDPVKHEEKRREILEAAWRCFVRQGFHGASTAQICSEAGVSSGHLYHYFDSKEAIVAAMVEIQLAHAMARYRGLMESPDPIRALIEDMKAPKTPKEVTSHTMQFDMLAEARRNPVLAKIVHDSHRQIQELLSELLHQAQQDGRIDPTLDPGLAAMLLLGIHDSTKSTALRFPNADAKKSAELVEIMLTRFLMPSPAKAKSTGSPGRKTKAR